MIWMELLSAIRSSRFFATCVFAFCWWVLMLFWGVFCAFVMLCFMMNFQLGPPFLAQALPTRKVVSFEVMKHRNSFFIRLLRNPVWCVSVVFFCLAGWRWDSSDDSTVTLHGWKMQMDFKQLHYYIYLRRSVSQSDEPLGYWIPWCLGFL